MHKALWLLPPLLGIAFYAVGLVVAEREDSSAAGSSQRASVREFSVPATDGLKVNELRKTIAAAVEEEAGRIDATDAAGLREMILRMQKMQAEGATDYGLKDLLEKASARLGKLEGADALAWVLAHAPDQRLAVMDGWADADPEGAFETIVHSDVIQPCSWQTLISILNRFGDQNPALLLEACRRVPLELFCRRAGDYSGQPRKPGSELDESAELFDQALKLGPLADDAAERAWVDSGAALEMERRGVDISALVRSWVGRDPKRALEQWQAGKGLCEGDPQLALVWMIYASMGDPFHPDPYKRMEEEIRKSSPEVRARIASLLRDYTLKHFSDEVIEDYGPLIDICGEESPVENEGGDGK